MDASTEFDFLWNRKHFVDIATSSIDSGSREDFIQQIQSSSGSDVEKKVVLDQAFRDTLKALLASDRGCAAYKSIINYTIDAANADLCSASIPFLMLSDTFDMVTLQNCEDIFNLVEDRVDTWKAENFYDAGKNYLLRMCNDLLRRLSKSRNTVFCGRIQLFLSRLFPLSEKSALNLMSQFNVENVTVYNTKPETLKIKTESRDDSMEIEDGEMADTSTAGIASNIVIDYNLYKKFWSLQDYFRKPTQCYDKTAWKVFSSCSDEVLGAFSSFKLDDVKSSKSKKRDKHKSAVQPQTFFAKYLTSEKLLDLQLSDSNFRRYVLVQFLILIHYFNSTVKFKNANYTLTEEQTSWIKTTQDRVCELLKETPPEGEQYTKAVEHILSREENWNQWKNDGCPEFERSANAKLEVKPTCIKRKSIGEDAQACGDKIMKMGNPELTRLWNINRNNIDACRAEKRIFLPPLEDFFSDAIEQNDPEAMVEEEYKLVNEQGFQWKALRLLARRSPHFFTHTNQPGMALPKYLETMVNKMVKEMPIPQEDMKTEVGEEEEIKGANEEEDMKPVEEPEKEADVQGISKQQITSIADQLGAGWKQLAKVLHFPEDDIAYFESENKKVGEQAFKMLTVWHENEDNEATPECLHAALCQIEMQEIANTVLPASSS